MNLIEKLGLASKTTILGSTMKNSLQIKQALIQIAKRNGRPSYEFYFVREVVRALRNGEDHPMRAAVEAEKVVGEIVAQPSSDSKLDKLADFCAPRGMRELLAKNSGLSYLYLSQILDRTHTLSDSAWDKFSSAFDRAETEFMRRGKVRKQDLHGTSNKYAAGCRCADCKSAMAGIKKQEYQAKKLKMIAEKYCGEAV